MIIRRSLSARRRAAGLSLAVRLETLEPRTLLSAITGVQVPDLLAPLASTIDGNGNVLVADQIQQLVEFHKNADGSVTDTVLATPPGPTDVVYDPVNQDIYVSNPLSDSSSGLQQYDQSGNLLATYTIDANPVNPDEPNVLTVAKDGSVWFGSQGGLSPDFSTFNASIGRIDLNGNVTVQQLPIINASISALSAAPDGSIWASVGLAQVANTFGISYLIHASSNSDGSLNVTPYTVPEQTGSMSSVAVAADGSVWYSMENDGAGGALPVIKDSINHATLSGGSLTVQSYAIPEQPSELVANGTAQPNFLTFDSKGQLWFADFDAVDTLDPATGDITRIAANLGIGLAGLPVEPTGLSVSATDVWISYPLGANFNMGDIDLTAFSPPIAAVSPDITATPGQAFSGPVALFASSDVGNFNYSIDFGNGDVQTGTLASNSSGMYEIDGSTTYATSGSFNTHVVITSDSGDITSVNGTANVTVASIPLTSQGINLSAQKGTAIAPNVSGVASVVVAQFTGPDGSYTATINWGDSTSTVGQVVSLGSNQYYVEVPTGSSKTYAAEGTFNISVVITNGTLSTTATSTATISAVPVVASQNLVLQPLLAGIVLNTVANFTADTSSTASWFRATINWGDGTKSVGLVVRTSAGHYTVIGLHIYAKKGTYAVDTTILDNVDAESALATATIKIK